MKDVRSKIFLKQLRPFYKNIFVQVLVPLHLFCATQLQYIESLTTGFQEIAYEGDFWSLCAVTFWQKFDFLISNGC